MTDVLKTCFQKITFIVSLKLYRNYESKNSQSCSSCLSPLSSISKVSFGFKEEVQHNQLEVRKIIWNLCETYYKIHVNNYTS